MTIINDEISTTSARKYKSLTQIDIPNTFLRCVDEMPVHYHFVLLVITP